MTTKQKAPATEPPVTRANSNQTEKILRLFQLVRHALIAIFLSPVYQTAIAVVVTAGIILMGGHHGF